MADQTSDGADRGERNSLDRDALAVSNRFRLFNFTRRDDHGAYRSASPASTGTCANRIGVRLADINRAVRESTGRGLPELLAELGGPLRDRPAERSVLTGARDAAIQAAQTSSLFLSCAWYRDRLAELGRDGTLTKLINTGEQARLGQAVRVLEYLAGRQDTPVLLPALICARG